MFLIQFHLSNSFWFLWSNAGLMATLNENVCIYILFFFSLDKILILLLFALVENLFLEKIVES